MAETPRHALSREHLAALLVTIGLGLSLSLLFMSGWLLSKQALVLCMLATSVWGLRLAASRFSPLALLPRLMIVIYAIPFSTTLGYLSDNDYMWVTTPARVAAAQDDLLIRQMLTVGLVGLIGLVAGIILAELAGSRRSSSDNRTALAVQPRTSGILPFVAMLGASVFLVRMNTRSETIFQALYSSGQSKSLAENINFPAASLLGYAMMTVLLIDVQRERSARLSLIKGLAWLAGLAIVVVVFQIMRGSRDSATLVATAAFLHATAPVWRESFDRQVKLSRMRIKRLATPLVLIVLVFITLGAARYMFADTPELQVSPVELVRLGFNQSTWTAVLWTNLSMAYMYRRGDRPFKYGLTYLDYACSLVPGFVAKALGVVRPLEMWQGPAWEFGKSIPTSGGIHVVVVPFMNFGVLGALFIMMLYGYFIGRAEFLGQIPRLWPRLIWVGIMLSSFKWFWYGDMIFVRALMSVVVAGIIYEAARQLVPKLGFEGAREDAPTSGAKEE